MNSRLTKYTDINGRLDKAISAYNKAGAYHNEGNQLESKMSYVKAYHYYAEALELAIQKAHPIQIYCKTGILQCQFMLGTIPWIAVCNQVVELKSQLFKMRLDEEWEEETHEVLSRIADYLLDPLNKAGYGFVCACKVLTALLNQQFDDFIETYPVQSKKYTSKIDYLNAVIACLVESIDIYKKEKQQVEKTNALKKLGNLQEILGNCYMALAINPNDQDEAFHVLHNAKMQYECAIVSKLEAGVTPNINLYFRVLKVCHDAKLSFMQDGVDGADYLRFFNLNHVLEKYPFEALLQEVMNVPGHDSHHATFQKYKAIASGQPVAALENNKHKLEEKNEEEPDAKKRRIEAVLSSSSVSMYSSSRSNSGHASPKSGSGNNSPKR